MELESPAFNLLSTNPNRLALLDGLVLGSCPRLLLDTSCQMNYMLRSILRSPWHSGQIKKLPTSKERKWLGALGLSLPTTLGFPRRSRSSSLRSTLHCCFREKRPFPAQNGKGIPRPTVYCHKLQRRVVSIWSDPWVSAEEHQQTKALKDLWRCLWIVSGCWQYYSIVIVMNCNVLNNYNSKLFSFLM